MPTRWRTRQSGKSFTYQRAAPSCGCIFQMHSGRGRCDSTVCMSRSQWPWTQVRSCPVRDVAVRFAGQDAITVPAGRGVCIGPDFIHCRPALEPRRHVSSAWRACGSNFASRVTSNLLPCAWGPFGGRGLAGRQQARPLVSDCKRGCRIRTGGEGPAVLRRLDHGRPRFDYERE